MPPGDPSPPGLRPLRDFLPLLAGPADAAAEQYRAWLAQPRTPRGGCGSCRHWRAGDLCVAGPQPLPAAQARASDGWPYEPPPAIGTPALRPLRTSAPYQRGGDCGPGARCFEARP
jgi:hypothetical protein